MSTLAIIDYGMGNLHSVSKAVEHVSPTTRVLVTADPAEIRSAERVIFPGVGAIRDCMAEIQRLHVGDLVREAVQAGKPVLGICVGMQVLFERSAENRGVEGLGILPGEVRFFGTDLSEDGIRLKVPHMGWNEVWQQGPHPMWHEIRDGERFYFVHSYHAAPGDEAQIAGKTRYGLEFASAMAHRNLFAVQFHPEKSQHAGLQLLANFSVWDGRC